MARKARSGRYNSRAEASWSEGAGSLPSWATSFALNSTGTGHDTPLGVRGFFYGKR